MEGIFLVGVMKGYSEKPWNNNPERFNRQIGIVTNSYTDQWGSAQENVEMVEVPFDQWMQYKAIAEGLVGEVVFVQIGQKAIKGGRDGAFIKQFMIKGSEILKATDVLKKSEANLKVAS